MLPSFTKVLLILGIIFIALAGISFVLSRLNIPLGKLPGDIVYQGKNVTCFIPIATMIVLSIVFSVILTILAQFLGRK